MPIIGNNYILFECFGKVNASFVHLCGLRACFVQMHQFKDRSNVLHPRENRNKHTIWPLAHSTHSHLLPPTCTGLYTHTHTHHHSLFQLDSHVHGPWLGQGSHVHAVSLLDLCPQPFCPQINQHTHIRANTHAHTHTYTVLAVPVDALYSLSSHFRNIMDVSWDRVAK